MRKGFMQSLDFDKYTTSQFLHPRFYVFCNPRNRSFCEEVFWTANGEGKLGGKGESMVYILVSSLKEGLLGDGFVWQ